MSAVIEFTGVEAEALKTATPKPRGLRYSDLQALPTPRWLAKGLLPAEGVAAIYGPSGSGKTFLALDLALHVAAGRSWFDHRVPKAAPMAYIALEAGVGIRRRLDAWKSGGGISRAVPKDFLAYLDYQLDLSDEGNVKALGDAIVSELGQGAVVIVDTLARACSGLDENSAQDMGIAIAGATALQQQVGGLVVLVHHSGKDSTKGMRGSSALFAALDAVISVDRWETPAGETLRQWKISKSKDGEDGAAKMFSLAVADLGVDEDGDAITSCYVTRDDSAVAAMARLGRKSGTRNLGEKQAAALRAATSALSGLEGGAGMAMDVLVEVVTEALKERGTPKDRARTKARERLRELIGRGLLQQAGERVFLPNKGPK